MIERKLLEIVPARKAVTKKEVLTEIVEGSGSRSDGHRGRRRRETVEHVEAESVVADKEEEE